MAYRFHDDETPKEREAREAAYEGKLAAEMLVSLWIADRTTLVNAYIHQLWNGVYRVNEHKDGGIAASYFVKFRDLSSDNSMATLALVSSVPPLPMKPLNQPRKRHAVKS